MTYEILFAVLAFGCSALIIGGCMAAYRNGVNDGYGFAREPECPGYRKAGQILRDRSAHRWPELREAGGRFGPPLPGADRVKQIGEV